MLHAKKTHPGPTSRKRRLRLSSIRVPSVLLRLNTRLLCSMQRKPIQDRLQRAKNRDEYLLLFPFSAPCVGVARAAFVARVTSVLGASTWVLVRTSARGSHSESKQTVSRTLEKNIQRGAPVLARFARHPVPDTGPDCHHVKSAQVQFMLISIIGAVQDAQPVG